MARTPKITHVEAFTITPPAKRLFNVTVERAVTTYEQADIAIEAEDEVQAKYLAEVKVAAYQAGHMWHSQPEQTRTAISPLTAEPFPDDEVQ
jgi:hypothetical protein